MTEEPERQTGPTEVVETESGELIERLSGGTATLLLVWLIGVGGLSTLLAAWLFIWIVTGERLGIGALFSGFGFYTSLAGAAGPCVLWLTGRAQGHTLAWFAVTAVKIVLVMVAIILVVVLLSTLVAAWLFIWIVTGERLGVGALFSGFGFYTSLAGAAGPCVLWLTGRAQGHTLAWFVGTAVKIVLVMVVIILVVVLLSVLVMAGVLPGPGVLAAVGLMVAMAIVLSVIWALATWAADRWIARARVTEDPPQ